MVRSIAFWLLWMGFSAYAFLLAPPNQSDTFALIKDLSTGQWNGINPLVIALFNIMGVLPMLYACLVFIDGRGQKVPAWLFASASFGVGAFALLPYLALRKPNPTFVGEKNALLKLLDSRWTALALSVGAIALLTYGLTTGDWSNFIQQWQSDRFIHVMSLDFCLLCLLFPALIGDDMARRGLQDQRIFWAVALVPLLGAIAYLTLRPPLEVASERELSPQS
ncbi:MAG: DUF2834 domain-containing protein [Leptolyngbyaceae cyanobacterium RM2_2_4]|nr:DUF2834 domain-containing protein [Leptolyngbyaceae cyanobacterium RM2_2_4]NJO67038.1 DUF2834 domain-containing protein [Leptolyngbyaceae cyanobacterium RM1_405_57]